ncbi:MAG: Zn-binding domain-containing protein, partial [bacterium]
IVDRSNEEILRAHLLCAAAEIPIAIQEPYLDELARRQISPLVEERKLIPGASERRWFPGVPNPHRLVNIRSVGGSYSIHDSKSGKLIGSIGEGRLWGECHPQAIYLHHARQHLVESLDDAARMVRVKAVEVDYYTQALGEKETEILERFRQVSLPCGVAFEGKLKVTERVIGYQKRRLFSGELISTHDLNGPPQVLVTTGFWIEMDDALQNRMEEKNLHYMGSLHAIEHALISLFPLEVICDRGDIGGISFVRHAQTDAASIFVYDAYPGGLGLTRRAYEVLPRLIERTLTVVQECPCEDGCPSCIHSPRCGAGNRPLDKAGAIFLLKEMLSTPEAEREFQKEAVEVKAEPPAQVLAEPALPLDFPRLLPNWLQGKKIVVFDLETQRGPNQTGGWANSHLMGLSIAVVRDLGDQEYRVYREHEVDDLVADLAAAHLIVGFNCIRFDFNVLSGYTGFDFRSLPVWDILQIVHRSMGERYSLNALAKCNLSQEKTGTGEEALRLYAQNAWAELEAYCRQDVDLTADLFFLALHEEALQVPERSSRIRNLDLRAEITDLQNVLEGQKE